MIEKELKIRDFCGDYALDIPDYNGSNFTLYFNSKRNAENVKRIIEIDGSKPNEAVDGLSNEDVELIKKIFTEDNQAKLSKKFDEIYKDRDYWSPIVTTW